MKAYRIFSACLQAASVLVCCGVLSVAHAANTNSPASGSVTNAAPAELPIPLSVFDLTIKPTKDPFFPLSLRQPVPQATNALPAFSPSSFTVKGLSGPSNHRLALINNRTLAEGEDAEVTTPSGKIKIHCLEIKESSVVLRAASQSEPVEVWLRKNAQ